MSYRNRSGLVIFKQTASSNLQVGANYYVNVRPPGAVVASGSSGTTVTVYAGHGFVNGQKMLLSSGLASSIRTISGSTGPDDTSFTISDILTLNAGDVLINLGDDTGGVAPSWDSTDAPIYSVPDNAVEVSGSLVMTNSQGEYSYWIGNTPAWEIVRDTSGAVQQVIVDAVVEGFDTPATTVDNAILRAVGTDGRGYDTATSNSPTIGDTGAVLIPSTLGVTGATTLSSTLAAGAATLASAAVTAGATVGTSLTVGTTLGVTGATTLTSTLSAGASTLASAAVTAGLTVGTTAAITGNITGSAHLQGGSAAVSITGNDAIVTADRFHIRLTNTSGTNTITLNAPSSVNGKLLVLECVALTAGTFSLADSGNVALSAAWTPNADDTLTLIAGGVVWKEIGRSTN